MFTSIADNWGSDAPTDFSRQHDLPLRKNPCSHFYEEAKDSYIGTVPADDLPDDEEANLLAPTLANYRMLLDQALKANDQVKANKYMTLIREAQEQFAIQRRDPPTPANTYLNAGVYWRADRPDRAEQHPSHPNYVPPEKVGAWDSFVEHILRSWLGL